MLQESLLFLHTADKDKNYNEELKLSSIKTSSFSEMSTVFAICILISILGLIGNAIIFWLLCCTIKKTKFTVYVANLVAGDFLALIRDFFSYLQYFTPQLPSTPVRQLILLTYFFGSQSNCFFLTAMSIERCLTVFSPVWYLSRRPKCSTAIICTFFWILSVMLSLMAHFLCTRRYIIAWNIGILPCKVTTNFIQIVILIILVLGMVVPILATLIRVKMKPQENFPARLDISIWVTVSLHLILHPVTELFTQIFVYTTFRYPLGLYYMNQIFDSLDSAVNPFVYLLVGCWKREKGQEPFYLFLERALQDKGKGRIRTQPDQEQA